MLLWFDTQMFWLFNAVKFNWEMLIEYNQKMCTSNYKPSQNVFDSVEQIRFKTEKWECNHQQRWKHRVAYSTLELLYKTQNVEEVRLERATLLKINRTMFPFIIVVFIIFVITVQAA